MQGKFRILQVSDNQFQIQKLSVTKKYMPKWFWIFPIREELIEIENWSNVDKQGKCLNIYNLPDKAVFFDLDSAVKQLEKIKKYPIVVYWDAEYDNK